MARSSVGPFPTPRPFLKWAGGKGQLLPELLARLAPLGALRRYHEPFVGGGALFFELVRLGRRPAEARLGDANPALVEAYDVVRDDVDALVARLRDLAGRHDEAHYYAVRAEVPADPVGRAARLIYLNKTCFNGLYRENSKGAFNVPYGRYTQPNICDEPNLRACARALQGVSILAQGFEAAAAAVEPGDVVYFDPPYVPLSPTASFTRYARGDFRADDQARLADVVRALHARGAHVLVSNSWSPVVEALYRGLRIDAVQAARSVNSRGDRRGKIAEALVVAFAS